MTTAPPSSSTPSSSPARPSSSSSSPNPYSSNNRVRTGSHQNRHICDSNWILPVYTCCLTLLILTARGYHRHQVRQTQQGVATSISQGIPKPQPPPQNKLRGGSPSSSTSNDSDDVDEEVVEDFENAEDYEDSEEDTFLAFDSQEDTPSTLDWVSDTLGETAQQAGTWMHSSLEEVAGQETANRWSESMHTGMDNLGSWFSGYPALEEEEEEDDVEEDYLERDEMEDEDFLMDSEEDESIETYHDDEDDNAADDAPAEAPAEEESNDDVDISGSEEEVSDNSSEVVTAET